MFATHFANALLVNDADAGAVPAEDAFGDINTFLFERRKLGSIVLQFDAAPVAEETFFQNFRAARRANSPTEWLSAMGAFHDGKLLFQLNRWDMRISTTFFPIVQRAGAQPLAQSAHRQPGNSVDHLP
jgi:hypothetical protein